MQTLMDSHNNTDLPLMAGVSWIVYSLVAIGEGGPGEVVAVPVLA